MSLVKSYITDEGGTIQDVIINYKDYKKRKLEEGVIPDKVSSEMDY